MINILFFAALREQLSCEKMSITSDNILTVQDIITQLTIENPTWEQAFTKSLLCAVNQEMVSKTSPVKSGDEVAFFPPVTGG